jgi:Ni,Fe-hydrogenase I small subunit
MFNTLVSHKSEIFSVEDDVSVDSGTSMVTSLSSRPVESVSWIQSQRCSECFFSAVMADAQSARMCIHTFIVVNITYKHLYVYTVSQNKINEKKLGFPFYGKSSKGPR